jgi:hypothetical protein
MLMLMLMLVSWLLARLVVPLTWHVRALLRSMGWC